MDMKNLTPKILPAVFVGLVIFGIVVFMGRFSPGGVGKGFLEASGRIEGREYNVGTRVAGRVSEIDVTEGDKVEAGQVIAVIHSEQAHAMLGASEARRKEAESNLELAKVKFERYERLFKANAVAKMEYDNVENDYIAAQEDYVASQKHVDKMNADVQDTQVTAPITGIITTKIVRKGEVVAVGTPLATMVNMDDLYLKVFLVTDQAGKVSLGDEARIYPDAFPGEGFDAYVQRIGEKAEFTPKNVETKSQRAKLVFEIKLQVKDNTDRKLKPGMPCDAIIRIDKDASWRSVKR